MSIDPRAASGFADVADAYARGRPGYPSGAIDRLVAGLRLDAASAVLDLAAGTGLLSRPLRASVRRVVAVEPMPRMRDRIARELPDVTVLDGTAEAIPLPDHAVDAVVVGEAFHWFDTAAAAAEIARVLTPAGGLAVLWNVPTWTDESTPWLEGFRRVVTPHRRAAGDFPAGNGRWRDGLTRTGLFADPEHSAFSHTHELTPADFLALVASWSWIASLDHDARRRTLDAVAAVIAGEDSIEIPYRTDLYLTRARATENPATEGPP